MAKKDTSLTIRFSESESKKLRAVAVELDMDVSAIVRACIALGLPILKEVPFTQRILLEDNKIFSKNM